MNKNHSQAAADAVRALMRMGIDEDSAVFAIEYAVQNEGVPLSAGAIRTALHQNQDSV